MKIVYVLTTGKGGLPHYAAELANAVSKLVEEVTVIKPAITTADTMFSSKINIINAFNWTGLSIADVYKRGMKQILTKEVLGMLISHKHIKKYLNEIQPDIIHFSTDLFLSGISFVSLGQLHARYPVIVTCHGLPHNKKLLNTSNIKNFYDICINIGSFLSLHVLKKIDGIIVHTKNDKNLLVNKDIDSRKIFVIPHGVYSIFKKICNEYFHEEKETILFFGNITPDKDINAVIEAIMIVKKQIPNIKLIIAGNGKIPNTCKMIIGRYKLNIEIYNYFIPNEKVCEFFSRASVVVIPEKRSRGGHSGVLTIAYSFGKPVIATNVGDFPILVRDSGCGFVVSPKDPKALAEAIVRILEDDRLRKKMSRNALKKAEELSWDKIAKRHIKVYEEVLEGDR